MLECGYVEPWKGDMRFTEIIIVLLTKSISRCVGLYSVRLRMYFWMTIGNGTFGMVIYVFLSVYGCSSCSHFKVRYIHIYLLFSQGLE